MSRVILNTLPEKRLWKENSYGLNNELTVLSFCKYAKFFLPELKNHAIISFFLSFYLFFNLSFCIFLPSLCSFFFLIHNTYYLAQHFGPEKNQPISIFLSYVDESKFFWLCSAFKSKLKLLICTYQMIKIV